MDNTLQKSMAKQVSQPRPRRMTSAQRREQILDKACELFAVSGFDAVSTKELATTLGISEALIFQHFPTKESIYQTLFEEWKTSEREPVVLRPADGSALTALEQWFTSMVTFSWEKSTQRPHLFYAISSRPSYNQARLDVLIASPISIGANSGASLLSLPFCLGCCGFEALFAIFSSVLALRACV